MTQLFHVYDEKGEAFEVRPDVAKDLVITKGWSLDPPVVKAAPAYVPEPVHDRLVADQPEMVAVEASAEHPPAPPPVVVHEEEPPVVHEDHDHTEHHPVAVNAQSDEART